MSAAADTQVLFLLLTVGECQFVGRWKKPREERRVGQVAGFSVRYCRDRVIAIRQPGDRKRSIRRRLRALDATAVACDFSFIDPPYADHSAYEQTLGFLSQSRLLKPTSTVIAEHDKHSDLSERYGALQRSRRLQQGDAVLSFFTLT